MEALLNNAHRPGEMHSLGAHSNGFTAHRMEGLGAGFGIGTGLYCPGAATIDHPIVLLLQYATIAF